MRHRFSRFSVFHQRLWRSILFHLTTHSVDFGSTELLYDLGGGLGWSLLADTEAKPSGSTVVVDVSARKSASRGLPKRLGVTPDHPINHLASLLARIGIIPNDTVLRFTRSS